MRRFLIALVAVFALVFVACGGDGGADTVETAPVTVTGDALPAFEQAGAGDPAIGMAMPEATGISFDSTPVSITNDGRAKILFFLAHW